MITKYDNGAVVQIATVSECVYHVACQRVLWNGTFWTNIYPRFLECVIWQINQLWGSSFFFKCSKFHVDFENARKSSEKAFSFWDNYFWIGCVKFSLLRREYWSSAVNVLTNTYKALLLTKTDFSTQLPSQWSLNMVMVLWSWLQQCLNPFTMLPVKGSFGTGLFGHISRHVFRNA